MNEISYTELNQKKEALRKEKSRLNKQIRDKYKTVVIIMHIIFILGILSNIGAVTLTNALVTKETPTAVIMEVNPVAAELHGFNEHPESKNLFASILIMLGAYCALIVGYIMSLFNFHTLKSFWFRFAFYMSITFILFFDFMNNFGFMLGKLLSC